MVPATERLRSNDDAQKIYGRPNDIIVAEAIEKVAAARGFAPAQVALAWTLSRPGMTAPISRPRVRKVCATRLQHVNDAAAPLALTLDADALRRIADAYEPLGAA
jgi:aryl-alcohol dehydrogenase-like predicted oxidoreductase